MPFCRVIVYAYTNHHTQGQVVRHECLQRAIHLSKSKVRTRTARHRHTAQDPHMPFGRVIVYAYINHHTRWWVVHASWVSAACEDRSHWDLHKVNRTPQTQCARPAHNLLYGYIAPPYVRTVLLCVLCDRGARIILEIRFSICHQTPQPCMMHAQPPLTYGGRKHQYTSLCKRAQFSCVIRARCARNRPKEARFRSTHGSRRKIAPFYGMVEHTPIYHPSQWHEPRAHTRCTVCKDRSQRSRTGSHAHAPRVSRAISCRDDAYMHILPSLCVVYPMHAHRVRNSQSKVGKREKRGENNYTSLPFIPNTSQVHIALLGSVWDKGGRGV
jgi:hypothetical protein